MKRLFTGIHWETNPEHRASVTIELDMPSTTMRVVEIFPAMTSDKVMKLKCNKDIPVIAVNVPFGWPIEFAKLLHYWKPTANFSSLMKAQHESIHRKTDRFVEFMEQVKVPSIATDGDGLPTYCWVDLCISQLMHRQIDVVGKLTKEEGWATIIESNPKATLRALRIHKEGYETDAEVRMQQVLEILTKFNIRHNDTQMQDQLVSTGSDSKQANALIAAVTALLYWSEISDTLDGAAVVEKFGYGIHTPNEEQKEFALKEGWTFFPRQV
jgi:hypothetical protein